MPDQNDKSFVEGEIERDPNRGEGGMATGADLYKAEAKRLAELEAGGGKGTDDGSGEGGGDVGSGAGGEGGGEEGLKIEDVPEETILAIQAKIQAKEDLSDEEKAVAELINASVDEGAGEGEGGTAGEVAAAAGKPKVYQVGDKQLSEVEAEAKMRLDLKLGNMDLSTEQKESLLSTWAQGQNKRAANKAIDEGFQANAEERKRLKAERTEARRTLEESANLNAVRRQELERLKARYSADAAAEVTETDVEEAQEKDKRAKERLLNRKLDAQDELQLLTEEEKGLVKAERKTNADLMTATIDEFIADHPEYELSLPLPTLARMIDQKQPVKSEDKFKVRELIEKLYDAGRTYGMTMEEAHKFYKEQNALVIKPAASSATPATKKPALPKPQTLEKKIEAYLAKKRAGAAAVAGAASGGPQSPGTKESPARKLIRESQRLTGQEHDDFVKGQGY